MVAVALGTGTRWLGSWLSIWKTIVSQGHTKMSSGEIKDLNVFKKKLREVLGQK